MNTFMLLVCLPQGSTQPAELHTQLAAGLARFDRSRRVLPYRIDVDLSPATLDRVLRAFNRTHALDGVDLDDPRQLWAAILAAHNGDLDDESDRLYLNPDGRPYHLHTTNPLGRFDRWVIGGRWRGRFVATPDAQPAQLIHPEPVGDKWRCAGGCCTRWIWPACAPTPRWPRTPPTTGGKPPSPTPPRPSRGRCSPTGTTPTPTATRTPRRWPTSTTSRGYGHCVTTTRTPGLRHASAAS